MIITDAEKVLLQIQPVDAAGQPAEVEGVPGWSVNDPNLMDLEVAPDGMSAWAITKTTTGPCQVRVVADADLGEGVMEIVGTVDFEIVPAQAVGFTINVGTPVPK